MRKNLKGLLLLALGASFVMFGQAQASQTNVILNLEGNPTCKSLGDNQSVLQVDVKGVSGTVGLPTTSGGMQYIDYVVGDVDGTEGLVSWEITGITLANQTSINPINYIILKNQGGKTGARVFHFGTTDEDKGATSDTDEAGVGTNLSSISFCYGLTTGINGPSQSEDIADLPSCDSLDSNGDGVSDLFTTGITCPTMGPDGGPPEEQVIINLALNKPNFGFEGSSTVRACTCNVTLPACNPELDVVTEVQDPSLSSSERSCLEAVPGEFNANGVAKGVNERVPFSIEGVENPDSYVCYVIGGRRYCYGHY